MASESRVWSVFSLLAALAAAALAKKALNTGWRATTGKNPPANPADPDVEMKEAVAWAVVSGTLDRGRADARDPAGRDYYEKSTGHLPPELRKDNQDADAADAPTT